MAIAYLDNACLGRASIPTLAAVNRAMEDLSSFDCPGTERTLQFFTAVDSARRAVASFVHADPACITLVANTTQGLGIIASSLPLQPGDNVLIGDEEFLGVVAVWRSIGPRLGIELREVPSSNGVTEIDAFRRFADQRTRALILSSVQEVSGYRSDLTEFGEFARSIGAYLIVDGIQEAGALPIDLGAMPIDAYCCGGHKWLRSPFGAGFLYVSPRLLDQLRPAFSGYTALQEPSEGWQAYLQSPDRGAFDPIPYATDARRLETGGIPNWIGAVALRAALEEIDRIGPPHIWKHTRELNARLRSGLRELGASIVGDSSETHESGIVCFHFTHKPQRARGLLDSLARNHIYVSLRYVSGVGGIRVSPHFDNTAGDIDRLLSVVQATNRETAA